MSSSWPLWSILADILDPIVYCAFVSKFLFVLGVEIKIFVCTARSFQNFCLYWELKSKFLFVLGVEIKIFVCTGS